MIEGRTFSSSPRDIPETRLTFQNVFARCRHIRPDGPYQAPGKSCQLARARRPVLSQTSLLLSSSGVPSRPLPLPPTTTTPIMLITIYLCVIYDGMNLHHFAGV